MIHLNLFRISFVFFFFLEDKYVVRYEKIRYEKY